MLEKLQLRDFQKHELLRIKLDPHVTTIVGPTDSGKSSVIRALRWLLTNAPKGDRFVRHGAEAAEVRVCVDGHDIARYRGRNGSNTYTLDEQEYRSFGTGVPEPIERLVNIGEDNLQQQHDPVFWFSETAGQVSRNLNTIVDLEIIDRTLGALGSKVREASISKTVAEEGLKEAQQQANHLAYVPSLVKDYEGVSRKHTEATVKERQASRLGSLVESASSLMSKLRGLAATHKASEAALTAETLTRRLRGLIDTVERQTSAAAARIPDISGLAARREALTNAANSSDKLRNSVQKAAYQTDKVMELDTDLAKAEKALSSIKICPTCQRPL